MIFIIHVIIYKRQQGPLSNLWYKLIVISQMCPAMNTTVCSVAVGQIGLKRLPHIYFSRVIFLGKMLKQRSQSLACNSSKRVGSRIDRQIPYCTFSERNIWETTATITLQLLSYFEPDLFFFDVLSFMLWHVIILHWTNHRTAGTWGTQWVPD